MIETILKVMATSVLVVAASEAAKRNILVGSILASQGKDLVQEPIAAILKPGQIDGKIAGFSIIDHRHVNEP